jgi:hypothetical protein
MFLKEFLFYEDEQCQDLFCNIIQSISLGDFVF